jgi:hypothetical protein
VTVDPNVLIGVASLAGVFVGFGALISVVRSEESEPHQLGLIRLLVSVSLVAIVGALVPLVLETYGIAGHTIWALSSVVYLGLLWVVIALALSSPAYQRTLAGQARRNRVLAAGFWLVRILIWVAIQLPLVLIILNVSPDRDVALYLTSVAFNVCSAAFLLAQIVYAQVVETDD